MSMIKRIRISRLSIKNSLPWLTRVLGSGTQLIAHVPRNVQVASIRSVDKHVFLSCRYLLSWLTRVLGSGAKLLAHVSRELPLVQVPATTATWQKEKTLKKQALDKNNHFTERTTTLQEQPFYRKNSHFTEIKITLQKQQKLYKNNHFTERITTLQNVAREAPLVQAPAHERDSQDHICKIVTYARQSHIYEDV